MTINTTAIRDLLRPGLAAIFGDYDTYPDQWTEIFEKHTSDKAVEIEVEMKLLGMAAIKAEGASVQFDTMGQRFTTNYVHRYVGIGYIVTRQAIKDNLYKSRFPLQAKALKRSFGETKNVLGAAVLNNGFDTNFPIGDGQPVYSTAHPIDGSTVANTFSTQADLNEASLQDAIVAIQQFKDQAGLRAKTLPQKLVVPAALQFTASRLLNSQFRINTANNDINAIQHDSHIPQGYRVNQFLTDANAWYVLTNADDGFKYYDREPLEIDMYTDVDNQNIKVVGIERYSFGCSNFRISFASSGST